MVHKRTRDGLKYKEGVYINSKIHQEIALGMLILNLKNYFLMVNTLQDILALSGVENNTWLRAATIARLARGNRRKRRSTSTVRTLRYQTRHNEVILCDTDKDNNRRKRRRQRDSNSCRGKEMYHSMNIFEVRALVPNS